MQVARSEARDMAINKPVFPTMPSSDVQLEYYLPKFRFYFEQSPAEGTVELDGAPESRSPAFRTATIRPHRTRPADQLWRARSRLYRSQLLQVDMRLKALAEIYTMHFFAQLCNFNFFCKRTQKISQLFGKSLPIF